MSFSPAAILNNLPLSRRFSLVYKLHSSTCDDIVKLYIKAFISHFVSRSQNVVDEAKKLPSRCQFVSQISKEIQN